MKSFLSFTVGLLLGVGGLFGAIKTCPTAAEVIQGYKCFNPGGCQCGCVKTGNCTCKNCNEPQLTKKKKGCCAPE